MRMAEPPPPLSAFVVEMVLVIGLFDPNEVSINGDDLSSDFSPSFALPTKTGILEVEAEGAAGLSA